MTVGDFYDHHATPSLAPLYLQNVPTVWKQHAKGKNVRLLCLELYIHVDSVGSLISLKLVEKPY